MANTILSLSDRVVIQTLHQEKRSLQYIADYLGFIFLMDFIAYLVLIVLS